MLEIGAESWVLGCFSAVEAGELGENGWEAVDMGSRTQGRR